ncbi:MAG TPA: PDZ domain-containing protein [Bacteroidota bacterium]|nr:PDZ domain-containing protein [Bacteroidota bacterium]
MTKLNFIVAVCCVVVVASMADAQKKAVRREGGDKTMEKTVVGMPDDMFDMAELAVIVGVQEGKVVIDNVMDKNMRPKENESVDIQPGDVIMMANGKRIKSIQDLKDAYAAAEIGSEVKLGLQRNDQMSIASFAKADPAKMPKRRIMINRGGEGGRDMMMLSGAGMLVGSKGKEVTIEDVMSDGPSALKDADAKKGDLITAVNDTKVTSFKEFADAFKKVGVGEKVTIHTSRNNKNISFTFTKSDGGAQRIIRRTQD